jgi:hypothetical protein
VAKENTFVIHNDDGRPLILNIEPEGAFFRLDAENEVSVVDLYDASPVTLKFSRSEDGDPIISIWPGDGEVKVEKGGVDVLDLV